MSKIPVVNENDELIEYKEREDLNIADIYRVSALWITNSQGQILLAQRAFTKSHNPGKWGPAVAGTVEEGEDYETNIIKEAEEELGLTGIEFKKINKTRIKDKFNSFTQWFFAIVDKAIDEFKIQKSEVEAIKWYDRGELEKDLAENPDNYLVDFEEYLKTSNII